MESSPILVSHPIPHVELLELNRPEVLNALNASLMTELVHALEGADHDEAIRCIVITGKGRAFAAGADINEIAGASTIDMLFRDQFSRWDRIRSISKPLIAAVNGLALGGGCELALACDLIFAAEGAEFGQPEINIGVIPGAGGTQRLARTLGKSRTMELVLSGRPMSAGEAFQRGLVNNVLPLESLLDESLAWAANIASKPPLAVRLAKESVLKAFEVSLREGLESERKNFYLLFSSEDQKEGMQAFLEKRMPNWKGR